MINEQDNIIGHITTDMFVMMSLNVKIDIKDYIVQIITKIKFDLKPYKNDNLPQSYFFYTNL